MSPHQIKRIIGWRELVDLPEWHIKGLRAKIDTGARTSSLHVEDIKELPHDHISFYVVLSKKNSNKRKKVIAKKLKKGRVKSSTGFKTSRWYVETKVRIGKFERDIRLNLISREGMNFRMLLGRTAIEDVFLVDVERSFVLSQLPTKDNK